MHDVCPKRKTNRLKQFDYSQNGAYFITICTKDRKRILSRVVGEGLCTLPKIVLTPIGKEIERSIHFIHENYENVFIDKYVIMPNHIHMIVILDNRAGGHGNPPLQKVIGLFKSFTTKQYKGKLWQRSFYDHIIRNEADYLNIWQYIEDNPLRWHDDKYYTGDDKNGFDG